MKIKASKIAFILAKQRFGGNGSGASASYVGETKRRLHDRVAEHAGVSSRTGKRLASPPHSNIRSHSELCDTFVKLDCFKILGHAGTDTERRILESLFIHHLKPPLNDKNSSFPLKIVF